MALPQCQNHPGVPVASITTMFPDGDTFSLCEECYVSFCVSMAAAMSGVDPEVLAAGLYQLAEDTDDEQPEDVATTTEGAPTDEPPEVAPADEDEGEAASWVENGGRPPSSTRVGGHGPPASSDPGVGDNEEGGDDDS